MNWDVQVNSSLSLAITAGSEEDTDEIMTRISSEVTALGEKENWPPNLVYIINLALEELGLNALTHGRDNGLDAFEITIKSEAEVLIIELSDNGAPFDPLSDAPEPDLHGPLETRPIGGLGIHLIRVLVDEMSYRREGDRNCLTLITRRS